MTTTPGPSRTHIPSVPRHRPYPPGPPQHPPSRPKWQVQTQPTISESPRAPAPAAVHTPPSPPRSRRGASETPSLGLGLAFGGSAGGKWWDEELPPPPASLGSILDSFRRSGEGDRELLLSILGAKKAEEERLTALVQTRLTILQARLSLHSAAAASIASSPPAPGGSTSDTCSFSSNGPETPPLPAHHSLGGMRPPPPLHGQQKEYYHLPPPTNLLNGRRSPGLEHQLAPLRMNSESAHTSPRSSQGEGEGDAGRAKNGLELLLDAGMGRGPE